MLQVGAMFIHYLHEAGNSFTQQYSLSFFISQNLVHSFMMLTTQPQQDKRKVR